MDRINKWGLLNSLIEIVNNESSDDPHAILAQYFLKNFDRIGRLNVYDLAEECYTSRASIRRFCKSLGYENFVDIKNEFEEYIKESSHYYRNCTDSENYMQLLSSQIYEMTQQINRNIGLQIEEIVTVIHQSKQIVFLVSDIYTRQCTEFQKEMILSGKMTYVVNQQYINANILKQLSAEDLLITISVGGFFAKETLKLVEDLPACKMLLTSNGNEKFRESYDKVFYMSGEEAGRNRSVYHMFGIEYCLEIIYLEYYKKIFKIGAIFEPPIFLFPSMIERGKKTSCSNFPIEKER